LAVILENEMPITVGWRMVSVQLAGAELARCPAASVALLVATQVAVWTPTPATAG
jgi:hypothetical protein